MKRLIVFLFIVCASLLMNAQRPKLDSIPCPAGDTIVYLEFFSPDRAEGMNFSYKDFDAFDAVLDLGTTAHPDSATFDRFVWVLALPHTLADSSVSIQFPSYPFRYLAIKLTGNSVTAGENLYYWEW